MFFVAPSREEGEPVCPFTFTSRNNLQNNSKCIEEKNNFGKIVRYFYFASYSNRNTVTEYKRTGTK